MGTVQNVKEDKRMLCVWYPQCGTCKKTKKWLDENGVKYTLRDIKEENPSYEELKDWYAKSGQPLKKFFNTSGKRYRELELKDRLPQMSEEEQLQLLASDGLLVKRPIGVNGNSVAVGFRPEEWEEKMKGEAK